jgi:hypothetical protein
VGPTSQPPSALHVVLPSTVQQPIGLLPISSPVQTLLPACGCRAATIAATRVLHQLSLSTGAPPLHRMPPLSFGSPPSHCPASPITRSKNSRRSHSKLLLMALTPIPGKVCISASNPILDVSLNWYSSIPLLQNASVVTGGSDLSNEHLVTCFYSGSSMKSPNLPSLL